MLVICFCGFVLRFYGLDERTVHHDEALHALYGRNFHLYPESRFYKYNPILHGPLLYHMLRWTFAALGDSVWSGRILMALFGSILLLTPLLFQRYFSKAVLLGLTFVLAFSPTLVFWSRFIRHDPLVVFSFCLMLFAVSLQRARWRIVMIALSIGFQLVTKEDVFITFALLLGFLIFEALYQRWAGRREDGLAVRIFVYMRQHLDLVFLGIALIVFVFVYFYSAAGRYQQGLTQGLFTKGIKYWFSVHAAERLDGPFLYNFVILAFYELPFLLLIFIQSIFLWQETSKKLRLFVLTYLTLAFAAFLYFLHTQVTASGLAQVLNLKNPLDAMGMVIIVGQALFVCTHHLMRSEKLLSFFGYFTYAWFFTYGYVGEKVPWLALYPFFAGLIYLALYFSSREIKKRVIIYSVSLVALAFLPYVTWLTNFRYAGAGRELLSQVHTSAEYEALMQRIIAISENSPKLIFVEGKAVWPTAWYLRDLAGFEFKKDKLYAIEKYDLLLTDRNAHKLEGFKSEIVNLREAWVPDYSKFSLSNFLRYLIWHEPWNKLNISKVMFWEKISEKNAPAAPQ